jgi:dipeptide/tripeptide permease
MMGAWFFATAVANALAGYVSELTTIPSGSNNPLLTNAQYAHVFGWLGGLAVGAGVLALVLTPALKKLLSPAPAQTNKRVIKTAKTLKITLRKDRILEVG